MLKRLLQTFPDKVDGQQALAVKKADLIYGALDAYPEVYKVVPDKSVRSRMNICFRVTRVSTQREIAIHTRYGTNTCEQNGAVDQAEKTFLKESTAIGLTGLKGHRSVGGIRASNYNSIPLEGAEKLAKFIHDFAKA